MGFIFTVVFICLAYIIYYAVSKHLSNNFSYSDCMTKILKKKGLDYEKCKYDKTGLKPKELEFYNKCGDKIAKKQHRIEKFSNCAEVLLPFFIGIGIVFLLFALIAYNVDKSYCLKTIKKCQIIEKQLAENRVYDNQDYVVELQLEWAEEKAFVENFPYWTFYNKNLVNKTYDAVMKLEIPKLEDTKDYILSINKDVNLTTISVTD